MFYCACRSCSVPSRTWLILLAKCIWSAWPPSIIFITAACEWALYYYFFHLFNYQMCFPILGGSAQSKRKSLWWLWGACVIGPHPGPPSPSLTMQASPAFCQLLEHSELPTPTSGHPPMPFPLAALLFPHFPPWPLLLPHFLFPHLENGLLWVPPRRSCFLSPVVPRTTVKHAEIMED